MGRLGGRVGWRLYEAFLWHPQRGGSTGEFRGWVGGCFFVLFLRAVVAACCLFIDCEWVGRWMGGWLRGEVEWLGSVGVEGEVVVMGGVSLAPMQRRVSKEGVSVGGVGGCLCFCFR